MKYEPDFSCLASFVVSLVESQAGKPLMPGEAWMNDIQTLSKKFIFHLLSMRLIAEGATLKAPTGVEFMVVDHSSAKVLGRAALETYLVLYYIYGGQDRELSKFRNAAWRLGGLVDRQGMHASEDHHKQILVEEKALIEALIKELETSPRIQEYSSRQQKEILSGKWRSGVSWVELGVRAGFHETYFRNIYEYLCGYAHSSYASNMQIRDAGTIEDQRMLATSLLGVGVVLMAHFTFTYSAVFPDSEQVLLKNREAHEIAERWHFGPDDMEHAYAAR